MQMSFEISIVCFEANRTGTGSLRFDRHRRQRRDWRRHNKKRNKKKHDCSAVLQHNPRVDWARAGDGRRNSYRPVVGRKG